MSVIIGFEKTAFLAGAGALARGIGGSMSRAAAKPAFMKGVGQTALKGAAGGALGGAVTGALQKDEQGNRGGIGGAIKGGVMGGIGGAAIGAATPFARVGYSKYKRMNNSTITPPITPKTGG